MEYGYSVVTVLLEVPFPVVEGAHGPRLQPPTDAVEVESVVAHAPCSGALFLDIRYLLRLTVDARLHDMVLANSAVINMDVPSPERDGVPLFDFESLLA